MNLNEITANIRLRNPWEAIDLGFAMVQQWWKSIYLPLMILTFSIAIFLYLVIPEDNFWLASVVFWWLKPLYDRLVLHIVSNHLFNNKISSWQALKALPGLIWSTGFFQTMTFRRFSLSRGFNLPIWQLEQLRGQQRSQRQSVLHMIAHTQAMWLTIALKFVELTLIFALFGLLMMFMPERAASEFFLSFVSKSTEYKQWIDYLNYGFFILVVTLIHPFYIAASFALYINRRTQLEAWDLELDFRKMSSRLKQLTQFALPLILVSSCAFALILTPSNSYAEQDIPAVVEESSSKTEFLAKNRKPVEHSKDVIKETMRVKNLNDKKTITYWVEKEKPKKKNNGFSFSEFIQPFAKFFGFMVEFGLWILVAIGILLTIYFRDRWLYLFQGKKKIKEQQYQAPEIMFGMDVRPDSLPENIIGEARKLWQQDKHRESLSLVYRGALVRLINQENIKLENSHTEGDVLRHSKKKLDSVKQTFLENLTQLWKSIAYAHRIPNDTDTQELFDHWASDFAFEKASKSQTDKT